MEKKTIQEEIEEAELCGLDYAGDYENGKPRFIGDARAWAKYNDGAFDD